MFNASKMIYNNKLMSEKFEKDELFENTRKDSLYDSFEKFIYFGVQYLSFYSKDINKSNSDRRMFSDIKEKLTFIKKNYNKENYLLTSVDFEEIEKLNAFLLENESSYIA